MKKILVIGAGYYQTDIIKRILKMGFQAYCVDRYANAEGYKYASGYKVIDILDKEKCLDYAKELGIDGVLTNGATITLPTVAYIGKKLGLPAISEDTAELSKSKFKIKKRLAENGCNIKGFFFETYSPEEVREHSLTFPFVIKPSDGSGSKGVSIVCKESEIETAIAYAFICARNNEVYVESYIPGEEYSVEAYSYMGEVYIYAIVKTEFHYVDGELIYGHSIANNLPENISKTISKQVIKAVKALEITYGSVNFDVIVSNEDNKPYIIDVGIRIGQNLIASHIVPLSTNVNEIDNSILASMGLAIDPNPKAHNNVATKLLTYQPGLIEEIKPYVQLIGKNNIRCIVITRKAGDHLPPYKTKHDTCGWVVVDGKTQEEAIANANKGREILKDYIIINPNK